MDLVVAHMQGAELVNLPCEGEHQQQRGRPGHHVDGHPGGRVQRRGRRGGLPAGCGSAVSQALVKSTATTNPLPGQTAAKRTVESLVRVVPAPAMNKAIFGNAGVETNKHIDVNGSEPGRKDGTYTATTMSPAQGTGSTTGR